MPTTTPTGGRTKLHPGTGVPDDPLPGSALPVDPAVPSRTTRGHRDQRAQQAAVLVWPLYAGMVVAGTAAVVASAATLAALARAAGWASWTPWLLPAALDVGGCVGGWCWLRPGIASGARGFGRTVALVGAGGTLVGNAAGHLIASGYLHPGPVLVLVVGAVPAAVLVALAHLAALVTLPADQPTRRRRRSPAPALTATPPAAARAEVGGSGARVVGSIAQEAVPGGQTRLAVLAHLRAEPATVADLVRVVGRSRATVVGHVQALVAAGDVVRDQTKRYRLRAPGEAS
ncbi:MAG: winged helix-turn-helix transcriptional regulator [Kineosporiaceae bacterium]|nr:winged helix-turn-helix transcriptional regulator [Kineosporiaceae bacterium]